MGFLKWRILRYITHMCRDLNSHYFHIIGDGHQPIIVGVYIPFIRIPIKRWDDHPQKNATFDHGTYIPLKLLECDYPMIA